MSSVRERGESVSPNSAYENPTVHSVFVFARIHQLTPSSSVIRIKKASPIGVISIRHENPIQPHLIRIRRRAVPEAASRSPRVSVQHATNRIRSDLILLLARLLIPIQNIVPNTVVVKTIVRLVKRRNSALLSHDEAINARAVPVEKLVVARAGDDGFVAGVDGGAAVPAVALGFGVVDDPRIGHAFGVGLGDAASLVDATARDGDADDGGGESQAGED